MGFYRYFCRASTRALIGVVLIASFFTSPAYSLDTKDSQLFITGFNAYLKKDYPEAIANLSGVLEQYPDTSLRDMAILWLSRSYYKSGNQQDAARYMAQFFKEYPDSPLKSTVEDELTELAVRYQKGESLPTQQAAKAVAVPPVATVAPGTISTDKQTVAKQAEADRQAADKLAQAKAEADRQAAEKLAADKAEVDRQAAEKLALAKAEADRQAAEKLALAKVEADRQAAEKLAADKADADRQAAEKLAQAKAEADRQEAEKLAQAKAEADRQEAEKLAQAKAEADRQAVEKLAADKAEADRQEAEKLALAKTEADRQAAEKLALAKVEADRQAAEKLAADKADADRQAAEKLAQAKAEADRQEAEKLAQAKAEADRQEAEKLAQAKAEADRQAVEKLAADKAEADRQEAEKLALAKTEADRQAAEKLALAKAEADRQAAEKLAADKAEADRQAAEKLALAKAEADRQAAEKLAQAKAEADRQAAEKFAQAKAEADRQAADKLAAAKAEADRQAAEKLAQAKAEADRQEAEKLAQAKAEADRQAAEKLAQAKAEADRQEAEKLALAKAEADRQAAEKFAQAKAEADRLESEKLFFAKSAADRQAAEKLAQAKAEADRQAAEKLAQAKAVFITGFNAYLKGNYPEATANLSGVLEKYPDTSLKDMSLLWLSRSYYKSGNQQEAGRYMAQFFKEFPKSPLKSTVEPALVELAEKYQRGEPLAVQQTAQTTIAPPAAAVEPDTIGTDKQKIAQQDEAVRIAAEKMAKDKVEQERKVAAKAEADRQAAAKLAKTEADRRSAAKLAQAKSAAERKTVAAASKKNKAKEAQAKLLRDQAIAEYKAIVDRYPGTPAAANAAIRLKELTALSQRKADAVAVSMGPEDNSNIFSIEVDQKANLDFSLAAEPQTVEIGKQFSMPFEVLNRGNSPDSFSLESGLPADYHPRFVAAADPDFPLVKTSQLLPGERFKGLIQFEMPTMSLDGERKLFPVKALSDADGSMSQSRPLRLVAKAPILRAVIKSDITQAAPGERIPYRLALLNVGSSLAREVSLRVTFPPQYEPVDSTSAGFSLDGNNTLVISGLQLNQGDRREIPVTMQLKASALAKEELFLHVDMINTALNRTDTFVSAPVAVKSVSGVKMLATVEKIIAVPGQTVSVLLAVTNTGNVSDDFTLKPMLAGNLNYSFYLDANRDGVRQANETIVSHVGPLAPGEVVNLILEITTSSAEKDGAAVPLVIALDSQNDPSKQASAKLNLVYSRPVLNLTVAGKGGKIKPGEVNTFELLCINAGSSMAKMVEIRSSLPDQLELVAAEPSSTGKSNGEYAWRFDELGSGEKRIVRVSYRIKSGTAVGTSLALKNDLKYQDQLGNIY